MGLRGAVDPELVMEVELSSWSGYPRRLRIEACRGSEDLFSGLHDPPSCWEKKHRRTKAEPQSTDIDSVLNQDKTAGLDGEH